MRLAFRRLRGSRLTLAGIAVFWVASDIGYYFGLPLIGRQASYNEDPIAVSLYYLFWVGLTVIVFWPVYGTWSRYAAWPTFQNRLVSAAVWCGLYGAGVAFAAFVLPTFPPALWPSEWHPAPDIVVATEAYFLPKSLEILFQQLLVVALILTLAARGLRLRTLSLYAAILFGGMHVLLLFGGMPPPVVLRYVVFAGLFGLVMPVFILRIPNGFALSYGTHWAFYAVTILLLRTFGAVPPPG